MEYSASIRDARLAAGLSLETTAERAGCSTSYVHKLELDRVESPSPRVLERLATVLQIDYGVLMRQAGYRMASQGKAGQSGLSNQAQAPGDPTNATILRVLMDVRRELAAVKAILTDPGRHTTSRQQSR
jgi:transcriptional regulator with XRE-family HTH domain